MMKPVLLAVFLAGSTLLTGCQKKAVPAGAGGMTGFVVQVVVVEAQRQPVTESLSLVGTVTPNEVVEIKSETDGRVDEIPFSEGQKVKQGDLLFRLDETRVAAVVAEAEANFKLSQSSLDRVKKLFQEKLISQQEYDQASAQFQMNDASLQIKRREWKDSRIVAPFSGIAGGRNVSPGQVISKNTLLTWLVDLDPVKVEIPVPERFLSRVRIGQTIDVKVAAFAGESFKGEVYFIAPQVDPGTRTALVKAYVKNPDYKLRGGMFANLDLTLKVRDEAVVIPEPALSQVLDGDRAIIYTVGESNTVQLTRVKLGIRLAGRVEIVEGLSGGEKVIVEGVQKIGPGARVSFAPPEKAAPYKPAQAAAK